LEIVFAAFLKIEFEKHPEQRLSPEYFLLYTAALLHFWHCIIWKNYLS
jgi:hypothetical protein